MPSIVPSYLYTFFALMLIGTILIGTFSSFAISLKQIPEEKQLKNILDYVAAKSIELINCALSTEEATFQTVLELPIGINHKQYWLKLNIDSGYALIEAGFGGTPGQAYFKTYLLANVSVSGVFISGFGKALLTCQQTASGVYLSLGYLEG